jgi:hypothetical protein
MKRLLTLIPLLAASVFAQDPGTSLEVARKEMQTYGVEIVGTAMNLDPTISDQFWSIYREYEVEREKIGDRKVALLREYIEILEDLSDEQAMDAAKRSFAIDRDLLNLKEKYYKIMEKQLSARVAARFVQVMNQIDSVVSSQLSRELPLIGGF